MDYKQKLKEHLDIIKNPKSSLGDKFDSELLLRLILCAMDIDYKSNENDIVKFAEDLLKI